MNVDPYASEVEETTRRAFLAHVEALLPTTGITWTSIEYRPIRPFGLILTAPNTPGEAHIIPLLYAHVPGSEGPSYQLLIKGTSGYLIEQCVTQDPQALVQALQRWAGVGQPQQRQALPALGEHDLTPLRQLATVRASIAQTTQQALASGIERGSEALERALGLVRADDFSHLLEQVAPPSQTTLAADMHHLAPDLLMTHFPREIDGRLPLGCTVLLASYDAAHPQSRDRQLWLAACAPQRRRDPQVVTLTLASLIGVNHAWRWDQARWFWDDRHQAASTKERWGVSGLTIERLGIKNRAEHVAFFAERCAQPHPSRADLVSLCLLLQDEGRLEEAFTLFGVELSAEVLNILYAQPFSLHTFYNIASWSSTLRSVLTSAAPWRFADLPAGTHHRLCALPHQTQQSKACLILATPKAREMAGAPRLLIKNTASNKLLPYVAWRRPLDLDLMRFQLSFIRLSSSLKK